MQHHTECEKSSVVYKRVLSARQQQIKRAGKLNAQVSSQEAIKHCPLNDEQKALLNNAIAKLGLTARGFHRAIKVACTIADLEYAGLNNINQGNHTQTSTPNINHLTEALSYRTTR